MKNRRMNTRNLVIVALILSLVIGLAVDYVNVYAKDIRTICDDAKYYGDAILEKSKYKCRQFYKAYNKKDPCLNTEVVFLSPGGKDSKMSLELFNVSKKAKKGKKLEKVTWKSSNPKVAKVVKTSGKAKEKVSIKGLKTGTCRITATYKKLKYDCIVTVTNETMLSSYYMHGGNNYTMTIKVINPVPGHTYAWFRTDKGPTTWTGLQEKNIWNDIIKIRLNPKEDPALNKKAQEMFDEVCAVGTSATIKIIGRERESIYVVDATEGYKNFSKSLQWEIDHKYDENGNVIQYWSNEMPKDFYTEEIKYPENIKVEYTHEIYIEPLSTTKGKSKKRKGYYDIVHDLPHIGIYYNRSIEVDPY